MIAARVGIIVLCLILVGSLVVTDAKPSGVSYQTIIINSRYEVTRVHMPFEYVDDMLVYNELMLDAYVLVNASIANKSQHKPFLRLIEEDPIFYGLLKDKFMQERIVLFPNMNVFWVTLDSFYAEVMNADEDEALEEVLRLAGYLWSLLRSNKIHVDRVRVYYLQIPLDPYIPSEMEMYYADKYFGLMDNGSIPEYVFMFGFLYGRDAMIPQFGGWLSCKFDDTKVLYTRQEVLSGIRSLADRMFGEGSPIVVIITSECPEIAPLPARLNDVQGMDTQVTPNTTPGDGNTEPIARDGRDVERVDTGLEVGGVDESYLLSFLAAVAIVLLTTFVLLGKRLGG